jgi:hypothetical protein
MLIRGVFSPGRMSASLALLVKSLKRSSVCMMHAILCCLVSIPLCVIFHSLANYCLLLQYLMLLPNQLITLLLIVFLLNMSIYLSLCSLMFELVLLCWFCQCIHLLLFRGVGPSSSWLPGKCDLCLFYFIALFLVATSLFLVWAPHTFRYSLRTSIWMGGNPCFSLIPNTCLLIWRDFSFHNVCK